MLQQQKEEQRRQIRQELEKDWLRQQVELAAKRKEAAWQQLLKAVADLPPGYCLARLRLWSLSNPTRYLAFAAVAAQCSVRYIQKFGQICIVASDIVQQRVKVGKLRGSRCSEHAQSWSDQAMRKGVKRGALKPLRRRFKAPRKQFNIIYIVYKQVAYLSTPP